MEHDPDRSPLCPSARPDMEGSVVFGVVGGTSDEPRVGYLTEPQATSLALLRLAETVKPTEVYRIAARCARTVCHDGAECGLARQIVDLVPPVTRGLPPCRIRPRCQRWRQEGRSACARCPPGRHRDHRPSQALRRAAAPGGAGRT
jgi:hypothetical protein